MSSGTMEGGKREVHKIKRLRSISGGRTSITTICAVALLSSLAWFAAQPAQAQTETVLHSFNADGTDGYYPMSGVAVDKKGNVYGTSYYGGSCGLVYKVSPTGTETILYTFACGADGGYPYSVAPVLDAKGNIYGTTTSGGANGLGTVFKVTPTGTETVIHSFASDGTDGYEPYTGLAIDKKGNLYGTTIYGGANGAGTVYKVTASGAETVLHAFIADGTDGFYPYAPVVVDKKGNVYGTTYEGGQNSVGTVFKVTAAGAETVLHSFAPDGTDGYYPYFAGLALGKAGTIYGTTYVGGANGLGTFYKLTSSGTETVLHSFAADGTDGIEPFGSLAIDKLGNVYGSTYAGDPSSSGTVYKFNSAGVETILYNFTGNPDGSSPYLGGVVIDKKGHLYGTTYIGGSNNYGTVFKITP